MLNKIFENYSSSTKIIIEEALRMGIEVKPIDYQHLFELRYRNCTRYGFNQVLTISSLISNTIINNKYLTKIYLRDCGMSVPDGKLFFSSQLKKAQKYARFLGWPIVIKPVNDSHGKGVILDIDNSKDFIKYWDINARRYPQIIVEKQFIGEEFRVLATKEKVLGVINRIPANVIGDGVHTIKQLIRVKNKDPRRAMNYWEGSLIKIRFNDLELEYLKKQKISLNDIPNLDKQIFLKSNSNISTGGDSIDVTDIVHPSIKKIAVDVINSIPGLEYAGIDLMTKDVTKKQSKLSYEILEINDSPGIDIHHFPYQGKPRNVAGELLKLLFPEIK